jgi:exopolysaccharide production protein ExoY
VKQDSLISAADIADAKELALNIAEQRVSFYTKYGKRLSDLALAILLMPFLLPLIAILALLVSVDGGAPFFGHVRVGRNGKHFKCWKLRTMHMNAEYRLQVLLDRDRDMANYWRIHQKLQNDPRVTPFGKLLRKTRLDELPQIYNVLMNELSFVGPRPFTPSQESDYLASGGCHYYTINPGITGGWQAYQPKNSQFEDRIEFDEGYAKTVSLKTDLKIILSTAALFFRFNGK